MNSATDGAQMLQAVAGNSGAVWRTAISNTTLRLPHRELCVAIDKGYAVRSRIQGDER